MNTDRWTADVVLNDGGTVHIRQIEPSDAPALQQFHARQSSESQYFRYFSAKAELTDAEAAKFCRIVPERRGALLVEDGPDLIAWADFERLEGRDDAEVAFHVDDAQSGRGIATLLLEHLSAMATAVGVRGFTAEVMADNRAMRLVFAHTGWPIERQFDSGVVEFSWSIDDTAAFLATTAKREQIGDSRSMARFLLPRSVVVIGASERPGSVGRMLVDNLRTPPSEIAVYAVNPHHDVVLGLPCVGSIDDIETQIDLALVAVPEAALFDVLRACARRRVRGAVVITEVSAEFPLAAAISDARRYGMRIVGPGSMGFANPGATPSLHAHLARAALPGGSLAVSLQSGSLGGSVLERANRLGVGLSWFVSLGEKADVSGNDLLQFWQDDNTTHVIAMYTESFGNPQRFARIARRVALTRPIVAVRPGNSPVHDALYQQAGVITVDTVAAMLDTARVLAFQPLARGPRVAVITNSASPARLLLAGLAANGLSSVDPDNGRESWQQLPWSVDPQTLVKAVNDRRNDGTCDAVVAIYAPPVASTDHSFAQALARAEPNEPTIPLIGVFLGLDDGPLTPGSTIPNFTFPDDVARVLGRCIRYAKWRDSATERAQLEQTPQTNTDEQREAQQRIQDVIDQVLQVDSRDSLLTLAATTAVLGALDVPLVPATEVHTPAAAIVAAIKLGFPVALKANIRPRRGRGAVAGIVLDLRDQDDMTRAWAELDAADTLAAGATVQGMVPTGVEIRLTARIDPNLGQVVSVDLGGILAGHQREQSIRLIPLGSGDAERMLQSCLSEHVREDVGPAISTAARLIETICHAAEQHHEIVSIDLNPVILTPEGCWVTDAKIFVGPQPKPDSPMRHLGPA